MWLTTELEEKMKHKTKFILWPVVIIWFLLFMPVGFLLFHRKMKTDKEGAKINSRIMVLLGIIVLLLNCYYCYWFKFVNTGAEFSEAIPGIILLTCISLHMFYGSRKVKESGVRYQRYMELIVDNHQTNTERIAAMMALDFPKAIKEIQEIIDGGYLEDSYLYDNNRRIHLSDRFSRTNIRHEATKAESLKVLICQNCGAQNKVTTGTVCECEYCKTPLS